MYLLHTLHLLYTLHSTEFSLTLPNNIPLPVTAKLPKNKCNCSNQENDHGLNLDGWKSCGLITAPQPIQKLDPFLWGLVPILMCKSWLFIVCSPSDLMNLASFFMQRSQECTWNNCSVSQSQQQKKWKLDCTYSEHMCNMFCDYTQSRCGGTIICNHPDCWFEQAVLWLVFQRLGINA